MVRTLAFAIIVGLFAWGLDDANARAEHCVEIEIGAFRLLCYDSAFGRAPEAAEAPATGRAGRLASSAWRFIEEASPMDDSPIVRALLEPKDVTYSGPGPGQAWLALQCHEGSLSVAFLTSMFFSETSVPVLIRYDEEPAAPENWSRSHSRDAVGLWGTGMAVPFLQKIRTSSTLAVRIGSGRQTQAVYDLGNVQEAVSKIATACRAEAFFPQAEQ